MHWKLKASLHNAVAGLPSALSYGVHYRLQRHFGGLRRMDAVAGLASGLEAWTRLDRAGCDPSGKIIFEVGTGRAPLLPLAFWLLGAKKTVTVDLHPYLRPELVRECLQDLARREQEVRALFGPLLKKRRLDALLKLDRTFRFDVAAFFKLACVDYLAPADAARTGLKPGSVDVHASHLVLQHIPPAVVERIIREGSRIVRDDGVFIHRIDYSDQFARWDPAIPRINFLRYSDAQWDLYAGNRYEYVNRLRHDDFLRLYREAGHRLLSIEPTVHQPTLQLLRGGSLVVDERFRRKAPVVLATTGSWIVSKKS